MEHAKEGVESQGARAVSALVAAEDGVVSARGTTGAVEQEEGEDTPDRSTSGRLSAWRMGLVVTASAFCGGIAVVLWNRRSLAKMREAVPVADLSRQGRLWEDDI